jgi:predicted permease
MSIPRCLSLLKTLFRRRRPEDDLSEELQFHLQNEIEKNITAGMSSEEARYAAFRTFGGVDQVKEQCRDMRGMGLAEEFYHDVKYGLRMLRKNPGFTAVAVITLALGIGANTAIFSLADAILLRPLPVHRPERLYLVSAEDLKGTNTILSYPVYEDIRDRNEVFSSTALAASGTQPEPLEIEIPNTSRQEAEANVTLVSGTYFPVLGVRAEMGRTLTPDDDEAPGGHQVAVVSYRFWKRVLGGNPSLLDTTIRLHGSPYRVVGVMPQGFFGIVVGQVPDVWFPVMMQERVLPGKYYLNDRSTYSFYVFGRLKDGLDHAGCDASLRLLSQQLRTVDKSYAEIHLGAASMIRGVQLMRSRFEEPLFVLLLAVGLVLLIACANLASLFLSRASARRREIAIRAAIGATRLRLFRQFLTESLLLAGLGGLLGLLFALWSTGGLVAMASTAWSRIPLEFSVDVRVFSFTATVSLLAGILFGIFPALRLSRTGVGPVLKDSGWSEGRLRLGRLLMVAQLTLSLFLLIGAGLLVRSLMNLKGLDPGFQREEVLVLVLDPRASGYANDRMKLLNLYRSLLEGIEAVPGVRAASIGNHAYFGSGDSRRSVSYEGHAPSSNGDRPYLLKVTHRFIPTLGLRLLAGRDFQPQDDEKAPRVAIVSESIAKRFFGVKNAVGRRLSFSERFDPSDAIEIVGVVKETKYDDLKADAPLALYVPLYQDLTNRVDLQIRTVGDPDSLVPRIREAVQDVDRNLRIRLVASLDQLVDDSIVQDRLITHLSGFFALLALALSAVGLYGVTTYGVARRTGEIGIRMALGARGSDILWMVLREAVSLAFIGAALGVLCSLASMRLIRSLLFGLSPTDMASITIAIIVLFSVVLLATYFPARRASRVDPMVALRYE